MRLVLSRHVQNALLKVSGLRRLRGWCSRWFSGVASMAGTGSVGALVDGGHSGWAQPWTSWQGHCRCLVLGITLAGRLCVPRHPWGGLLATRAGLSQPGICLGLAALALPPWDEVAGAFVSGSGQCLGQHLLARRVPTREGGDSDVCAPSLLGSDLLGLSGKSLGKIAPNAPPSIPHLAAPQVPGVCSPSPRSYRWLSTGVLVGTTGAYCDGDGARLVWGGTKLKACRGRRTLLHPRSALVMATQSGPRPGQHWPGAAGSWSQFVLLGQQPKSLSRNVLGGVLREKGVWLFFYDCG